MNTKQVINTVLHKTGLSVSDLADRTGVSDKNYYKMLEGRTNKMNRNTANAIHDVFPQFSLEWLRLEVEKEKKENIDREEYSTEEIERSIKILEKSKARSEEILAYKLFITTIKQEGVIEKLLSVG